MPDFVGASSGIFELMQTQPEIVRDAFALRNAGLQIVRLMGKRTSHPVTVGIGCFSVSPAETDIEEIRTIADDILERHCRLIQNIGDIPLQLKEHFFPGWPAV